VPDTPTPWEDAMSNRLLVATVLALALVFPPQARAVTITFEVRPDGTPIVDEGGEGCGEIEYDTFRPWGVLFTPNDEIPLNISSTLVNCLSPPNALGRCTPLVLGAIDITFVVPGTDISTVVDGIDLTLLTTNHNFLGRINTYDPQGVLLDTWDLTRTSYCYKQPRYLDAYRFSAPGRIARVECILQVVRMDNVIVTEVSTPVETSTWGRIKALYP
jgi:hypothetical protein